MDTYCHLWNKIKCPTNQGREGSYCKSNNFFADILDELQVNFHIYKTGIWDVQQKNPIHFQVKTKVVTS